MRNDGCKSLKTVENQPMALVLDKDLYSWNRLQDEGIEVIDADAASKSALRELHIGFLNMMPDRAVRATERQFLRLISAGANDRLIHVHPFTIDGLDRDGEVRSYIKDNYLSFPEIETIGLDGVVLTGANPGEKDLKQEKYWPQFEQVARWADASVPTVMCSCLASHAVLHILYGIQRRRCVPGKRWGVYRHQSAESSSPLIDGYNSHFDVPRSHVFEMTSNQLTPHGIRILASSPQADFHIAVSPDGFKWVYLQGHPEYDDVSLFKEFKREINRFLTGVRNDYPEYPTGYFNTEAVRKLDSYRDSLLSAKNSGVQFPDLPESQVASTLNNTWTGHGEVLFRNWADMIIRYIDSSSSQKIATLAS